MLDTAITARAQEALENAKDIKASGRENEFVRRLAAPRREFAQNAIRHSTLELVPSRLIEVVAFGVIIVVALYYLLSAGTSSSVLAIIALYTFAAYRLVPTLKVILDGVDTIRYNAPALEIICRDFDPVRAGHAREGRAQGARARHRARERLLFLSRRKWQGLERFDGPDPAGEFVCVMGPTGAGKSTALDVLLGLLPPDAGRGADRRRAADSRERRCVAQIDRLRSAVGEPHRRYGRIQHRVRRAAAEHGPRAPARSGPPCPDPRLHRRRAAERL